MRLYINFLASLAKKKLIILIALAPMGWGLLSYLIFVILKSHLPNPPQESTPKWIWLWLLQMIIVIPLWRKVIDFRFQNYQRWSLGGVKLYLGLAYLSAVPTIWFYETWYTRWLVFGGIVSSIFEEMFTRHLLTPWLKENWLKFIFISTISSVSFSFMHWGFNSADAFSLTLEQQMNKFVMHFTFGLFLCLVFRVSRSTPTTIWLHFLSNLRFIWPQI